MKKMIQKEDYKLLHDEIMGMDDMRSMAIKIIIYTGCRPNEALSVNHKSITFTEDHASVFIKASKRSESRTVRMPHSLLAQFKDLRKRLDEANRPLGRVLGNTAQSITANYKIIVRHFENAQHRMFGEKRYTLKSWRHTLLTNGLKSGMDIVEVQTMAGHKSITSTLCYLREYKNSIVLNNVHKLVEGAV